MQWEKLTPGTEKLIKILKQVKQSGWETSLHTSNKEPTDIIIVLATPNTCNHLNDGPGKTDKGQQVDINDESADDKKESKWEDIINSKGSDNDNNSSPGEEEGNCE